MCGTPVAGPLAVSPAPRVVSAGIPFHSVNACWTAALQEATAAWVLGTTALCELHPRGSGCLSRLRAQLAVSKPYRKARLRRNRILAARSGAISPSAQVTSVRWWSPWTGLHSSRE